MAWVLNKQTSSKFPAARKNALVALVSLWAWLVVMGTRPHKEERFMFVVGAGTLLEVGLALVAPWPTTLNLYVTPPASGPLAVC